MIGVILLVLWLLSPSAAQTCDVRGIEYSSTMERDGFTLTPLSEEQKRSENKIECAEALELVYLPPHSDSVVQLSLLKCERTPHLLWQYHLKYSAQNGSEVEEWRTNKIKAACRKKVCTACPAWSFPCEGANCVKPAPEPDADGCPIHTCPENRIRVNSQAATIGRPHCKRTGEDSFEWFFNGEPVKTATCVNQVNCSAAVPPLQCGAANCDRILTTNSSNFKCKGNRELRITLSDTETAAEGVFCSDERWMWFNSSRVPLDLPKDADLRCVAQLTIPGSAYEIGVALPVCIFFVCFIFLFVAWLHFRMNFKRRITELTQKLNAPVLPPPKPATVVRRKVHRPLVKLTAEQETKKAEEHKRAMDAAVEHFKKKFPHLVKPVQSTRQNKQVSTTEKRPKPSVSAKETSAKPMTSDSRKSRGDNRRRRDCKGDSWTSKKNRRYDDDESDSESSRRRDDSLDERSAKEGVPSERRRKGNKRRRQEPKRRKSSRSKRSQKDREDSTHKVDTRRVKTQKEDRTQVSEVTEKTQVEDEKTAKEKKK